LILLCAPRFVHRVGSIRRRLARVSPCLARRWDLRSGKPLDAPETATTVREHSTPTLKLMTREFDETADPDRWPDERLKLLFVCAHPAIDSNIHTPLILQTVLGLDAVAIGRALRPAPKTIGQ